MFSIKGVFFLIKLMASDMDGTLLNSQSVISEGNKLAILKARQAGIDFMIATGRGRTEVKPVLKRAGLNLPMITVNGAQVFDESGQLLFSININQDIVLSVIDILNKYHLYFELATSKGTYSNSHIKRITTTSHHISTRPKISPKLAIAMTAAHLELLHVRFVDDFSEVLKDTTIDILKFIVFSNQEYLLEEAQKELALIKDITVTSSGKNNIEINHVLAQKGLAVKKVAEIKNISLDEVATIGDNFNDVSMLEVAGMSFAMENGPKEVHDIARFVTKTNDEDGVAFAIEQILERQ